MKKSRNRAAVIVALSLSLQGCTLFFGAAHTDTSACIAKCRREGMRIAGLVFHGEFATSCVCEVPRDRPATASSTSSGAPGAAIAAAARPVWRNWPVLLP